MKEQWRVALSSIRTSLFGILFRDFCRTFFARGITAFGSIFLAIVIGRFYGSQGVGAFALAQSFLLGTGILAKRGMDNGLIRYVGRDHTSEDAVIYMCWSAVRILLVSGFLAAFIGFNRWRIEHYFNAPGLAAMLSGISFACVPFSICFLLAGFFKGVRKPATACFMENGAVTLIAGLLIFFIGSFDDKPSFMAVGYIYAFSSWLVVLQGLFQLFLWGKRQNWWSKRWSLIKRSFIERESFFSDFRLTSDAFLLTNFASFIQSVLGIFVIGLILSSDELGVFKVAQQAAYLIGFVLVVMNAIFPPRFASLYYQGKTKELSRVAKNSALFGVVFSFPILLMCLVFPATILALFGNEFEQGATLLRIISVAQMVNVATGSVGFLLSMTGYAILMRNIAISCSILGLFSFYVFTLVGGLTGAGLALAFVMVCQNLVMMYFVWAKLGILTVPYPRFSLPSLGTRMTFPKRRTKGQR